MRKFALTLSVLFCAAYASNAMSQCIGLVQGPIVLDITYCAPLDVRTDARSDVNWKFYSDFTKPDKEAFLKQYKGYKIRGKVVKSDAVQKGLNTEKGALNGKMVTAFVQNPSFSCANIEGKRISGNIKEFCCTGGVDCPCLLKDPYTFSYRETLGNAGTSDGDKTRESAKKSADYKKAQTFFAKKDWKNAAVYYERAKDRNELDVLGYYNLGFSYRKLENYAKASKALEYVHEKDSKGQLWGDQIPIGRKAHYLLAVVYANLDRFSTSSDGGRAKYLLEAYLSDPTKYSKEINDALKTNDFGCIRSTKFFQQYEKDARNALGKARRGSGGSIFN